MHYAPLVKYVAGQVAAGMPSQVDRADLVSYGIFGLLDAIEKYDTARPVKFETHALTRIRGAILDELRSLDWVPRSVRAKTRELQRTYETLLAALGRAPTDVEAAAELGVSVTDLRRLFTAITAVQLVSLDQLPGSTDQLGDIVAVGDILPDPHAPDPAATAVANETSRHLAAAIRTLPDRLQTVIALYYYEGLTLAQIGQVLGVTESRTCQLHASAVVQLHAHLAAAGPELSD